MRSAHGQALFRLKMVPFVFCPVACRSPAFAYGSRKTGGAVGGKKYEVILFSRPSALRSTFRYNRIILSQLPNNLRHTITTFVTLKQLYYFLSALARNIDRIARALSTTTKWTTFQLPV